MPAGDALPLAHAVALGVLHGPTELLPVSSSGHVTLVPWLLGWPYEQLDPELQKAFEVALHAGTAAALLIALRDEVSDAVWGFDVRRAQLVVLSFVPPAIAGLALERPIERYLGTPPTIAAGLLLGSAAMLVADRRGPTHRRRGDAGAVDALWLGAAQACALVPGTSRNGMTLAAARWRGFGRADANELSRHVALPVIVGATVLKGVRLVRGGVPPATAARLLAGAAASFASTLGSTWVIAQVERDRSLAPYAAYRTGLAAAVIARAARGRRRPVWHAWRMSHVGTRLRRAVR